MWVLRAQTRLVAKKGNSDDAGDDTADDEDEFTPAERPMLGDVANKEFIKALSDHTMATHALTREISLLTQPLSMPLRKRVIRQFEITTAELKKTLK